MKVYYDQHLKDKLKDLASRFYVSNDAAHMEDHINDVCERAISMVNWLIEMTELSLDGDNDIPTVYADTVDLDALITICTLHDIGGAIDREHHNTVSADIFMQSEVFKRLDYTNEQRTNIFYSIVQHSSHFKGKYYSLESQIMASADRDRPDIYDILYRSVNYSKKHNAETAVESTVEYNCNRYNSIDSPDYHVPLWHYPYWEYQYGYDVFAGIHKFFKNEQAVTEVCTMIYNNEPKDKVQSYITDVLNSRKENNKIYAESVRNIFRNREVNHE